MTDQFTRMQEDNARVMRVSSPVKLWVHRRMSDRTARERHTRDHRAPMSPTLARCRGLWGILRRESHYRERRLQVSALMKLYPALSEAEITALIELHLNLDGVQCLKS